MLEVKIKKLNEQAVIPEYAKPGDAGMDLTAINVDYNENYVEYYTGLAVKIPEGYVGLLFPRSSVSSRRLILANSVGVIDSGYTGEIRVRFYYESNPQHKMECKPYNIGDRVAQLIIMPYPQVSLVQVDELEATERGEGGFGSTGLK